MSDKAQLQKARIDIARQTLCPADQQPCYAGEDKDAHWRCGTVQCGRQTTDDKALEILRAMRPSVPESALRSFMAGTNGPYLHVDPDEFRRIAQWIITDEVPRDAAR